MPGYYYGENAPGLLRCARVSTRKVYRTREPVALVQNCWTLGRKISKIPLVSEQVNGLDVSQCEASLYAPGVVYYQHAKVDAMITSCWVQFWGYPPKLKELTRETNGCLKIHDPDGILLKLMLECANCADEGEAGYWKAHTVLCRIFNLFNDLVPDEKQEYTYHIQHAEEKNLKRPLVQEIHHYFDRHYREKITLGMLAKHTGVSISSLAHQYRKETGKAVMEDLMHLRLNQSIPLLYDGMPLKNIAESVGFCNQFYYSLQFKKFFGCSPIRWISEQPGAKQEK